MTIHALRLRVPWFERGLVSTVATTAKTSIGVENGATADFDEDGRLYVFRFPRRPPERVVIDRDRIFQFVHRRRPTADGRSIPLLPDISARSYVRDMKNRADFFTDVRELQTHPDVECYAAAARIESDRDRTVPLGRREAVVGLFTAHLR